MSQQQASTSQNQSLNQWKKKITSELTELWSEEEVNTVFQVINQLEEQGRALDTIRFVVHSSYFGGQL